jgi:hypothetical protein
MVVVKLGVVEEVVSSARSSEEHEVVDEGKEGQGQCYNTLLVTVGIGILALEPDVDDGIRP